MTSKHAASPNLKELKISLSYNLNKHKLPINRHDQMTEKFLNP